MPTTVYGTPANAITQSAAIGAYSTSPGDETWYGYLDDVRIFDHVLSSDQISAVSNILRDLGFSESKDEVGEGFLAISTPAGTNEGDLLIAVTAQDGNAKITPPSGQGWSLVTSKEQGGSITLAVWSKTADASEPPSHQFASSTTKHSYAWMMRIAGHDPDNPINNFSTNGGTSASPISGAVTTTVEGCLIIRIAAFDGDSITVDNPGVAGHTTITMDKSSSGPKACSSGAAYIMQSAIGSSGTANFTLTSLQQYRAVTIAIAPDPQTVTFGMRP
jgi:hypothetical protein